MNERRPIYGGGFGGYPGYGFGGYGGFGGYPGYGFGGYGGYPFHHHHRDSQYI
ncbi:hypothetical protein [Bacillus velezensis]|uniref:hypothetical protein n=1 Tax=Bacillus velezensis TaxID=492670 RepID=UPI002FFE9923